MYQVVCNKVYKKKVMLEVEMYKISSKNFKGKWAFILAAAISVSSFVVADPRKESLVVVTASGPNSMDIHRSGTNRPSYQVAVNMYDRLVSFGIKGSGDQLKYDSNVIKPELAASWKLVDDGLAFEFMLREDATFWDGSPVSADDVTSYFDRAVSLGGFPSVQILAGGLPEPELLVMVHHQPIKYSMKS